MKIKAVKHSINIAYSDVGVTQIDAKNWEDAFYGLGWSHGHDRGLQVIFMRTIAQGRLCELIQDSDDLLQVDIYFRRLGLALHAKQHSRKIPEPFLSYVHAYVSGLNDGWQSRIVTLQSIFKLPAEAFRVEDCLLLAKLSAYAGLAEGQRIQELFFIKAIQRGWTLEQIKELIPHCDECDVSVVKQIKQVPSLFPNAREKIYIPVIGGSNAWAVSGRRSVNGSAMLANDPHLEVNRLPPALYEAKITVDSNYVKGGSLPGLPGFITGRNKHLSWGVTYSCADTSDFFVQKIQNGKFLYDNKWLPFTRRDEIIKRKNAQSEKITVYENHHGILEGNPNKEDGYYLAWNWTGFEQSGLKAFPAFMNLMFCNKVERAQKLVSQMDIPTLHMVFADDAGNIGYQFTGTVPKRRKGWNGLLPANGWEPGNDWQGFVEDSEKPKELNPSSGYIVITNENRECNNGRILHSLWLSPYRQQRINELLNYKSKLSVQDFQAIQYDCYSTQVEPFKQLYIQLLPKGPMTKLLEQWDNVYADDSEAATLFERIHKYVASHYFGRLSDEQWFTELMESSNLYSCLIGFFDKVMLKEESSWLGASKRDTIIASALKNAIKDPLHPWGKTNEITFNNMFLGGKLPEFLGFDKGPLPLHGNHATVFQGTILRMAKRITTFAPCYHFVTDMHSDETWTNLPGGHSESRFSRRYTSDLMRWFKGEYKKL